MSTPHRSEDSTPSSDHPPPCGVARLESIPADLRRRDQWICWVFRDRDGGRAKCPICPVSGASIDATDPTNWVSFERAVAAWRAGGYAGIGFVFAADDPFCGVDLDGCIDDEGRVVPSAMEIVRQLDSYAEVSPSGRGVKVFMRGRKPEGVGCRSKAVEGFKETEVYDRGRFFTVTGRHLEESPAGVEERQEELGALCSRLWPKTAERRAAEGNRGFDGDDDELIRRARSARNGDRFARLWDGDTSLHGGDASGADQALCNLLAFWTGRDASRMDRLFRRSGLYRAKWDERRGERTYGAMTIETALADCRETYSGARADSAGVRDDDDAARGETGGGGIALGDRDPKTGRLVLSPTRTLPTARRYVDEFHGHPDGRTLHAYGGQLMAWSHNRYRPVEDGIVRQRLQGWLDTALRHVRNPRTGEVELVGFESNPSTVNQALESIRALVHLPVTTVGPAWLDGGEGRPPACELLACRSMTLHVPTGRVLAPTPALFTTNALEFDYEADPEPPERWIKFLEQVFGEDLEAVSLLQEWMGYCLIPDTSQQKMLLLVGPRRSGKGTIGRVMTRLVGEGNVAGPTTGSLAGAFGLQPLIDKSLAIVSDARFGGDQVGTVVERLLCITGEDTLTIDRKFMGSVSLKLPTRFMFLTNELPRLSDASNALAGRFLVLRIRSSFYGREDTTLSDRLAAELPGILRWSIDGLKRLKARGRFVQPASGEEDIRDMEDLGSPVGAFARECCVVGPGHRVCVDDLYRAWRDWCEREGRSAASTKQSFGRDLMAASPRVSRRRGTGMVSFYEGISLVRGGGA